MFLRPVANWLLVHRHLLLRPETFRVCAIVGFDSALINESVPEKARKSEDFKILGPSVLGAYSPGATLEPVGCEHQRLSPGATLKLALFYRRIGSRENKEVWRLQNFRSKCPRRLFPARNT